MPCLDRNWNCRDLALTVAVDLLSACEKDSYKHSIKSRVLDSRSRGASKRGFGSISVLML